MVEYGDHPLITAAIVVRDWKFQQKLPRELSRCCWRIVERVRYGTEGGLKYRRRIILWIVYIVGLVWLAIWASWRHKQEVAHRFEDSRCSNYQTPGRLIEAVDTSRIFVEES